MKLGARIRGFTDAAIVEGGADAERRARDELRRRQRLYIAEQSGRPELAAEDLAPAHLNVLETPSGDFYVISRGEQYGEQHDTFAAYVRTGDDVIFLERPSGAKTRQELEARRSRKAP